MTEASATVDVTWKPSVTGWRKACLERLETRFGWLRRELDSRHGGNVAALKDNEQKLWRWRTNALSEFNRIGKIRDDARQITAYRRLWIELS